MSVYITFERGRDDAISITFGPFDWLQVTYDGLRVPPDGEHLASFCNGPFRKKRLELYFEHNSADLPVNWDKMSDQLRDFLNRTFGQDMGRDWWLEAPFDSVVEGMDDWYSDFIIDDMVPDRRPDGSVSWQDISGGTRTTNFWRG